MKLPVTRTPLQIRFMDIDMLGHVSNSVYPQFFDTGRVDFFITLTEQTGVRAPVSVVRHVEFDLLGEITLNDKPEVDTWCEAIGNTSMTMRHTVHVGDRVVAEAKLVLVFFDEETRSACPAPEGWEPSAR